MEAGKHKIGLVSNGPVHPQAHRAFPSCRVRVVQEERSKWGWVCFLLGVSVPGMECEWVCEEGRVISLNPA